MNMTNLLLQMTYAAVESAQNTMNDLPVKTEDGKDFETMLKDKTERPAETDRDTATEKPESAEDTNKTEDTGKDGEAVEQMLNQTGGIQNAGVLSLLVPQSETGAETMVTEEIAAVTETVPEQETAVQLPVSEEAPVEEIPVEAAPEEMTVQQPVAETPKAETVSEDISRVTEEAPEAETVEGKTITVTETKEEASFRQETGTGDQPSEVEIVETTVATKSEPLFENTESMPQRVGDAPVLDAESPEFDQNLTKETMTAFEAGKDSVTMKLTPDHLGEVVVKLQTDTTGVLHVVIHAESDEAAMLLKEHSGSLVSLLQNSRNGEVQLEIPQPRESENAFHQAQEDGSNKGNQQQQQSRRERETDSEQFMQQLRLGLVRGE